MGEMPRHSVSAAGPPVGDPPPRQRGVATAWRRPELDETIEGGVRREVLEETGIRVEPEHLTGVYKHMRLGVIALVFRCHAVGGVETTGGESIAVDWLTPEQITERMQMPRRAGGRRQQEDRRRPLGDSDDIRDDGES